jgi:hypothetical protein
MVSGSWRRYTWHAFDPLWLYACCLYSSFFIYVCVRGGTALERVVFPPTGVFVQLPLQTVITLISFHVD